MSEIEEEAAPDVEPTGPFQPAIHDGIPVELRADYGGRGQYGSISKKSHPPLACPQPRHLATLRGFYRCPACGVKVPLAGQTRTAELYHDRGERAAEALGRGVAQAFWLTVDIGRDIAYAVRFIVYIVRKWVGERGGKDAPAEETGPASGTELAMRLALMGMIAARYTPRDGQ